MRPDVVFELGIHHISRPLYSLPAAAAVARRTRETRHDAAVVPPVDVRVVPTEVGFVHHYRDCTNDYEYELDCNVAAFVIDDTVAEAGYIPTLMKRVQARLSDLRQLGLNTATLNNVSDYRTNGLTGEQTIGLGIGVRNRLAH